MVSVQARREQVRDARGRGLSCRRACALIGIARSSLGYEGRRTKKDRRLRRQLRTIARTPPRYGYRRARAVLASRGEEVNAKRVHHVWREEALMVPRRPVRKRVRGSGLPPVPPTRANHVWAHDFLHDECANARKLKRLTVIDEYTRRCLAVEVEARPASRQVIEVLGPLMSVHGAPAHLRDDGPEFIAKAVKRWLGAEGIATAYIDPGKPDRTRVSTGSCATNAKTRNGSRRGPKRRWRWSDGGCTPMRVARIRVWTTRHRRA